MRIECPECAAQYEVPAERLTPGRSVRCARCGRDWVPVGEPASLPVEPAIPSSSDGEAEPGQAMAGAPAAIPPLRARPSHPFLGTPRVPVSPPPSFQAAPGPARQAPVTSLGIGWLVTACVLVLAGWAAVEYRGPIARAWPPSLWVYNALDLRVAPPDR